MENTIDYYAKIIWDYMLIHQRLQKSDVILVLGSHDTKVAEYAAEIYHQGLGNYIVCSGNTGKVTNKLFSETEAKIFSDILIKRGVPNEKIFLEERATNTGENILFTKELLERKNINIKSLILVNKPYMERRTFATFSKQWQEINFIVTSPNISYEEYMLGNENYKNQSIEIMVGDLQRIKEYPKLGFQISQDIPDRVLNAWQKLVDFGFTKYFLS